MIAAKIILWVTALIASAAFVVLILDAVLHLTSRSYRAIPPTMTPSILSILVSGFIASAFWVIIHYLP